MDKSPSRRLENLNPDSTPPICLAHPAFYIGGSEIILAVMEERRLLSGAREAEMAASLPVA